MGERVAGRRRRVTKQAIRRAYAQVDGRQLHYREAGEESNPTLVLLHQSPSHSAMYETLMHALSHRFHLLAPDTPGFGNSDPLLEKITVAAYARAIHDWLWVLNQQADFIFGHHTGAAIAVQLAHDYPGCASALALSGPPLLDEQQQKNLPALAAPFPVSDSGDHLTQLWQRIRDKDPQAPLAITEREVISALACRDAYQGSYRAVADQEFAALLPGITCPVLVFAGDADPLYDAVAPTLALLSRGEEATLEGGERTYVCERQAPLVARLLEAFFGQLPRGGEEVKS